MIPRPTLVDRAVGLISPRMQLDRMHARAQIMALTGGYDGAKPSRSTRFWRTSDGSADAALLPDLSRLRARSKDLQRNSPLAGGAINTNCVWTIGSGLRVKARIDRDVIGLSEDAAQALEAEFEAEFNLWADDVDCDLTRTQRFGELQDTVLRSMLVNGDVFSIARVRQRNGSPFALKAHLLAGARVSNPTAIAEGLSLGSQGLRLTSGNVVLGGIEKDSDGAPVAIHVSADYPAGDVWSSQSWTRVPIYGVSSGVRQVFHHFERQEVDQTRGEPYLAPVIEALHGLGLYTDSELKAAVIASLYTVFVKTETGQGAAPVDTTGTDPASEIKLEAGGIVNLKTGEVVEVANPGRPNQEFDPFVQAILRQVGVRLGLPFETLILHFTASYSAARAALLAAWKTFAKRRDFVAASFCQPYYQLLIWESVLRGRVSAPGFVDGDARVRQAYLGTEWIGPAPGQIDPEKEARAAVIRIEEDLSTRQRETASLNGGDWDRNVRQRAVEERTRAAAGLGGGAGASDASPPDEADDSGDLETEAVA